MPPPLVKPVIETFETPLVLESGAVLDRFEIEYECYGQLSPARDNAVLVCHALSGDAHAAWLRSRHDAKPGWWDLAIGPGGMLDTDRSFVICSSVLGGAGRSTGPATIDVATGQPYGMRFPVVTIADMVAAQARLIERLGIGRLHAVIGGCMGGFQAIEWGRRLGDRVENVVAISVRPSTSAYSMALWEVIRRVIRLDPAWRGGDYYHGEVPNVGSGLAMAISLLHWIAPETVDAKYGRRRLLDLPPQFSFHREFLIEHLIDQVSAPARDRIDPNAFLYLTRAVDYFDLAAGGDLVAAFSDAGGRYCLVSYEGDPRYPQTEAERLKDAIVAAGRPAQHHILSSSFKHGAFQFDLSQLQPVVNKFLYGDDRVARDEKLLCPSGG